MPVIKATEIDRRLFDFLIQADPDSKKFVELVEFNGEVCECINSLNPSLETVYRMEKRASMILMPSTQDIFVTGFNRIGRHTEGESLASIHLLWYVMHFAEVAYSHDLGPETQCDCSMEHSALKLWTDERKVPDHASSSISVG